VETPVEGELLICHPPLTSLPGCDKEHPRQATPALIPTFNKASPTAEKLSHSGRDGNHPSTHTRSSLHVTSNHSSHSQDTKHPSAISPTPLLQYFTSSFPAHRKTSHAPSCPHQHPSLPANPKAPTYIEGENTREAIDRQHSKSQGEHAEEHSTRREHSRGREGSKGREV
jgi:hypothetical protein